MSQESGVKGPRKVLRFAAVGGIGFLIDSAVLTLLISWLEGGLLSSRVISYLTAASATWYLHREYTFKAPSPAGQHGRSPRNLVSQWALFVTSNGVGGLINYAIYAALVFNSSLVHEQPVIGVAIGSAIAMSFNFLISQHYVFRTTPRAE